MKLNAPGKVIVGIAITEDCGVFHSECRALDGDRVVIMGTKGSSVEEALRRALEYYSNRATHIASHDNAWSEQRVQEAKKELESETLLPPLV